MKNTNWLANIFIWIHEVISEADKPISLVVMVILPFIAPLLPAMLTARSLEKFMNLKSYETWIAVISFELIGYLGMIAVVGALMRLIKNPDEKLIPALRLNFGFYVFAYSVYLLTLITSNAILEWVNGASLTRVVVILCLTVGLSLSAGILNASRIHSRDEREYEYEIRQEKREDSLKRLALKKGINVFALDVQDDVQNAPIQMQNNVIYGDWRVDEGKLSKDALIWLKDAPVESIMKKYNLKRRTAFSWKERAKDRLEE